MKPSQLICRANHLTGFYMMRTLVVKGLSYCEIFKVVSVISTKLVVKKWKSYSQRPPDNVIRSLTLSTTHCKIFWEKLRNQEKLEKSEKLWYLLLRTSWAPVQKIYQHRGESKLGCDPMQFWDFANISWVPKL